MDGTDIVEQAFDLTVPPVHSAWIEVVQQPSVAMPPLDRFVEQEAMRLGEFVVGRVDVDHRCHPQDDAHVFRAKPVEHVSHRRELRGVEDESVEIRCPARIDVHDAERDVVGDVVVEHLLNIHLVRVRVVQPDHMMMRPFGVRQRGR